MVASRVRWLLAFGHPMASLVTTDVPLVAAYVHGVMPASDLSSKLAPGGQTLGRLMEEGKQTVRWRSRDPDGDESVSEASWSADQGKTWARVEAPQVPAVHPNNDAAQRTDEPTDQREARPTPEMLARQDRPKAEEHLATVRPPERRQRHLWASGSAFKARILPKWKSR